MSLLARAAGLLATIAALGLPPGGATVRAAAEALSGNGARQPLGNPASPHAEASPSQG